MKDIKININLGTYIWWFISSAFILWGYSTIAPLWNLPYFGYWDIFAMRMALGCVMQVFWQRK